MTETRPYPKSMWIRLTVALLFLFQFFTFSGFSDLAPSRESRTQSEWVASFSDRQDKTISFRRASHKSLVIYEKQKTVFRRGLYRQNNRYLTWLALLCTPRSDDFPVNIPIAAWPRSATADEYHS